MKCAVCKTDTLQPVTLEAGLQAHVCSTCGGTWIVSSDYWAWREAHGPDLPEQPAAGAPQPVAETETARACPTCSHILLKFRVGHDVPFTLDHCGNCNGVWFDRQEWDMLRQRNLHDDLHSLFTTSWQRRVRQEEHRQVLERIYTERFGAEDYAELRRIRVWLDGHPQRSSLLAYLSERDPYKLD